jgi:hypothetical protein
MTQYWKTYNKCFDKHLICLNKITGENGSRETGAWANFVDTFDVLEQLQKEDWDCFYMEAKDEDGTPVWVWKMDEDDWKHTLVDRLCVEMDFGLIERLIADVGIMNAFKMATDTGLMDAVEMEELGTEMGIRKLFYCVLGEHLYFNETDQYEEITKDEWLAYDERMWNDDSDKDSDEDEEDSEDEEDDA